MTRQFAVVGSPIAHSKSPALHNAAFEYLSIDAYYSKYEVASGLSGFIEGSDLDFAGLSVTMPLKDEALKFADRLDDLATKTASCNTLVPHRGEWLGFNTDVIGLNQALRGVPATSVLIVGSGATARSAFEVCRMRGDEIRIWARDSSKLHPQMRLAAVSDDALTSLESGLLLSTVPQEATARLLRRLEHAPRWLFSAAYSQPDLLLDRLGDQTLWLSGLDMLLWQAVAQQALFAGGEVEEYLANSGLVTAMREALERAVGE